MIIGVTGNLATGTSTAAKYITSYLKGKLIDADKLAHLALRKNSPAYKSIVSSFGRSILSRAGAIDRKKLGKKAFATQKSLERLCNIIHPVVISRIEDTIAKLYKKNKSCSIIVDGPVLIESNFYKRCDKLIVVMSSLELQLERAVKSKRIGLKGALSRISFQMPLHKKVRHADYIIDNGGSLKELKQKCRKIAKKIGGI